MAALCRDLCDLEACRPSAYNDDASCNRCLRYKPLTQLAFAAGTWIMDAANRLFLTDLEDAGVIAGNTYAHEIDMACLKFVWRFRISNELAGHAD